jgi:predicted nucleic acid-binding protein
MRFLDSNVLVYTADSSEPDKQAIARAIVASNAADSDIVISTQVLQEFFWTASRKFANRTEPHVVDQALRDFARLQVVQVDVPMILAAAGRVRSASISFWDALIVEAALVSGATRLLTEDLQDGHVFDGVLRVENPFRFAR